MSRTLLHLGVPVAGFLQPLGRQGLGPVLSWCWGADIGCDGPGPELETCLDFPYRPTQRDAARCEEMVRWAALNLRHPYRYVVANTFCHIHAGPFEDGPTHRSWRWMFADLNDAFAFKMRWG